MPHGKKLQRPLPRGTCSIAVFASSKHLHDRPCLSSSIPPSLILWPLIIYGIQPNFLCLSLIVTVSVFFSEFRCLRLSFLCCSAPYSSELAYICCDMCDIWHHYECVGKHDYLPWFCHTCCSCRVNTHRTYSHLQRIIRHMLIMMHPGGTHIGVGWQGLDESLEPSSWFCQLCASTKQINSHHANWRSSAHAHHTSKDSPL